MGKQNKTKTNPNNTNSSGIPNTKMVSIVGRFAISFFCINLCCRKSLKHVRNFVVAVLLWLLQWLLLLFVLWWLVFCCCCCCCVDLWILGVPRARASKNLLKTHTRAVP